MRVMLSHSAPALMDPGDSVAALLLPLLLSFPWREHADEQTVKLAIIATMACFKKYSR
jgi:hypothetical protein